MYRREFDADGRIKSYALGPDGQTGRYVQSDPIGLQGGINTYVHGNPLTYIDPTGLADMNLFGAGDANMKKGADAWSVRGAYTVAGHGNQFFLQGPNLERIYPEALAEMINNDPNYKGQTVILGACYSARDRQDGKPGLAEQLSKFLNGRVIGSSEAVWYSAGGMHGSGVTRPTGGDTGPWTTKLPRGS